jgi:crotonobetainyl-CoA:carnitine CoA-transferase CaiB-like acyl-CoA transferase
MSPPLSRFQVVDRATARSGPTCTGILADSGAEVLRVERPEDLAIDTLVVEGIIEEAKGENS